MGKMKWKVGYLHFFFMILLVASIFHSIYYGAEKNITTPTIKRGATVIIVPGVTREWKDADKTPLDQRPARRRMKPVLNFKTPRRIVRPSTEPDPVIQRSYTSSKTSHTPFMPTPIMNFSGMNLMENGSGWPPDTTGDVGVSYFVQAVNTSIGIYNKSNGSLVSATTYDDFFAGTGITGTPCDENNNGDPIVLYDPYEQRWIVLDFAWDPSETDGSYFSIAVSQTSDPTGAWWQYALRADITLLNDYPKAGIWHDGIYVTANMFSFSGEFQGVRVWSLKKPDIYNGTLIAQTLFDNSWYAWSILPTNAKGANPPPSNAPNYMYSYDADEWGYSPNDVLAVWKMDVDWNNAANTTWTGPTTISTAPFSLHNTEISQLGTSNTLDTLYSRLMFAAMYRNHSSYESVYLCHLADASGIGAMRWYEVRISGGTSSIYQQGTYAPDTDHRWMGSVCGDSNGNIAMGYSVSSSSMYPAIRYAGRLSPDPLNLLAQGEASMIEGTGSQTVYNRWGDYSTMAIDPVDNKTFWYTQEYLNATGTNWETRIGSFKLAASTQLPIFDGWDFSNNGSADISVWRPSTGI